MTQTEKPNENCSFMRLESALKQTEEHIAFANIVAKEGRELFGSEQDCRSGHAYETITSCRHHAILHRLTVNREILAQSIKDASDTLNEAVTTYDRIVYCGNYGSRVYVCKECSNCYKDALNPDCMNDRCTLRTWSYHYDLRERIKKTIRQLIELVADSKRIECQSELLVDVEKQIDEWKENGALSESV